jgi:hypothetical protein
MDGPARRDRQRRPLAVAAERDQLVDRLRSLGVRSSEDLKGNREGQALAVELQELTGQIRAMKNEIKLLDQTITRTESGLRRLERRQLIEAGGAKSEKEYDRMIRTALELEEELRGRSGQTAPDPELNAVLDEALRHR